MVLREGHNLSQLHMQALHLLSSRVCCRRVCVLPAVPCQGSSDCQALPACERPQGKAVHVVAKPLRC